MDLPDLSAYRLHRTIDDAELDGVAVPGLRAEFFRRPDGDRLASVGRYHYRGQELLLAWGYVGEEHCRYSAARHPDGAWSAPTPGCPQVEIIRADGEIVSLIVGGVRDRQPAAG